jgi:pimeloyl-ACP methyl ester carboxylesterase
MIDSRLWSQVEGIGPTVVFLHGFMESSAMWNHLSLNTLPCQLIFIDLPGHGHSPLLTGEGDPSIAEMATHVMTTLKGLNISDFDVVGHSMGGYVALELKKKMAGCRRVVLLNSNFWEDSLEKKRDRIRVADLAFKAKDLLIQQAIPGLFFRKELDNEHIQSLIKEAKNMLPESIAYSALAMRNRKDHSETIQTFPNSFLMIHGMNDPLISVEVMRERTSKSAIKVVILPNAGHMSHIEQSAEIQEVLLDFLRD